MRKIELLSPCKFHEFFPHLNCIYYILPTYTGWKDFIFFLPLLLMKKLWGDGAMHIQKKGKRNHFFPTHLVFVWRAALKAILVVALSILFVISHYYETISFYLKQDVKKTHDKSLHFLVLHMYWCRKYDLLNLFFLENIFMKNFSSWSPDTFSSEECIEL